MKSHHPSLPSGLIMQKFPAVTRCWSKAFSHNCVMCTILSNVQKRMSPCILFPSATFGGDTNSSTSSGSIMVNSPLSTGVATCSLSLVVKPNWLHQSVMAAWILMWFTEWIVWNKSSVFIGSPLKWMVLFPFFASTLHYSKHRCLWRWDNLFHWLAVPSCWLCDPTVVRESRRTLSFPILDPEKSNVLVWISLRNPWPLLRPRCNSGHLSSM